MEDRKIYDEEKKRDSTGVEDDLQLTQLHERASNKRSLNSYILLINLWATIGAWIYDSISIIASSLTQPSMGVYFNFAGQSNLNGLIGAVASLYNVGGFCGFIVQAWMSDRYGRKVAIGWSCVWVLIGQALSGGCADNWGMLIFARFVTGFGGWPAASAALVYQSELSIAETRGFITGSIGWVFALAYATTSWVGFVFFYANPNTWRIPFLLGIVFPIIMLATLPLVPETPRWLGTKGRWDEAYAVLVKIHKLKSDPDDTYAKVDFTQIKAQLELDKTFESSWWSMFAKKSYRKRSLLAILVCSSQQLCGIQAITNFAPLLYRGLGYDTEDQLLISAGWITVAPIVSLIMMFTIDKMGRKPMIILAPSLSVVTLTIYSVLNRYYEIQGNPKLAQAAVAFTYIYIACYLFCECATFVYIAEIFPSHIRSKGVSLGLMSITIHAVWIAVSTPTALASLGWKYGFIFVGLSVGTAVLGFIFLKETKGVPLEEMAARFGDDDLVAVHQSDIHKAQLQH